MINFNGTLTENHTVLSFENRGYAYGDALFETIRCCKGKLLFFEDHYFRLMASMRIMRMEIPMNFTQEFLEDEINRTLTANQLTDLSSRIKLTVHRNTGGLYLPQTNSVGYIISVKPISNNSYILKEAFYQVDLFKDFYLSPSLLSTLKSNNKALNVIGSIFAKENDLDNCLLLNTNKQIVEALNGNVFLVVGQVIKTPPLTDGCLKGIMRTQLMHIINNELEGYQLKEASISPFEIQKADELFITNVIYGIQPVSRYRKKVFGNQVAKKIVEKLNTKFGLI